MLLHHSDRSNPSLPWRVAREHGWTWKCCSIQCEKTQGATLAQTKVHKEKKQKSCNYFMFQSNPSKHPAFDTPVLIVIRFPYFSWCPRLQPPSAAQRGLGKGKGNLWQRVDRSQPLRIIFPRFGKTGLPLSAKDTTQGGRIKVSF